MKNNLLITLMVGLLSCHYFTANALIAKRINNELSNLNREESSDQAQDLLKQINAPSNGMTEINPVSDLPPQANSKAVELQKQEEIAASDSQVGNKLLPPQAKQEITNVASTNSPSNNNPQVISNSAPSIPQAVAFYNQVIESNPESSATQAQQSGGSLATSTLPSNLPSSAPVIGPLRSSMLQEQQNGGGVATFYSPSNAQVIGPLRSSMLQEQQHEGGVATFNSPSTIPPSNAQVIRPLRSSMPQEQQGRRGLPTFNSPSAILPSNSNPQGTNSGSKNDKLVLQDASKSIVSPNNLNNNPLKNDPVVKSSMQNSNEKSQTPTGAAENGRSSFNPELLNPRNIGYNYVADTVSNQNRINSNRIAIGVSVGMLCLAAALLVGYNYKQSKTSSSPAISSEVSSIKDNSLDNSSIEDNSLDTDPELLDVSVQFD